MILYIVCAFVVGLIIGYTIAKKNIKKPMSFYNICSNKTIRKLFY